MVSPLAALLLLIVAGKAVAQLTSDQKQMLLDLHNEARRDVLPTAANMQEMEWNDELAQVAQNYSEKCIFQHNPDRTNQQKLFNYVGENLGLTSNPVDDYAGLFTSWVNERSFYDLTTNDCSRVCGHYTQIVWTKSNNLGCGATRCSTVTNFFGKNALVFVCNYGPGGNYYGQSPYTAGVPCSSCPDFKPFCSNDLCSNTADSVEHNPHFFLPLANGDHLCFTAQGKPDFAFNLIRDKHIQLNSQFVLPAEEESHTLSTFVGDLELTIKDQETGNVTVIKVSASDHSVLVGHSLTVVKDRPVSVDVFDRVAIKVDPHVQTANLKDEFAWLSINTNGFGMKVRFHKKHLDMFLTKINGLTKDAHGLIGQFLTADVRIDTENMLMQLGDRKPIAVKKGMAWPFLGINEECWYGTTTDNREPKVIEGIYTDYIVEQLIPN